LRTAVLVIVALVLMVFDHRQNYLVPVRSALTAIVSPIQYAVNWPVKMINWVETSFASQEGLLEENTKLRANQLLLQAKLQRLLAVEEENTQLRALLSSSPRASDKISAAQLLAVDLNPLIRQVVLDRGEVSRSL